MHTPNRDEYKASILVAICHLSNALRHLVFAHGLAKGLTNAVTDLWMVRQSLREADAEAANAIVLLEEDN